MRFEWHYYTYYPALKEVSASAFIPYGNELILCSQHNSHSTQEKGERGPWRNVDREAQSLLQVLDMGQ